MRFSGLVLSVLVLFSGAAVAADLKLSKALGSLKAASSSSLLPKPSPSPTRHSSSHPAKAVIGQKLASDLTPDAPAKDEQVQWRALVVKLPGSQLKLPHDPGTDRRKMALYGFLEMRLP